MLASNACTAYTLCMQYTIRRIPRAVDAALRRRAKNEGRSLNAVAVDALTQGAGVDRAHQPVRDLSDVAGTWQHDPAFDEAIAAQDQIDESIWK
jgi:plasmid stability protein